MKKIIDILKKLIKDIRDAIIKHLVSLAITALFAGSLGILQIFTKIKPLTDLFIPLIMWRWSGWIALIAVLLFLYCKERIFKKRADELMATQKPPKYYASHDNILEEREYGGVIWKIYVGSNVDPSSTELGRDAVFAWPLPCAYCPECDYELDVKRVHWYCMPCGKKYKIPKELRINTWDKIRRNYDRLIVKWGYNNFGIAEDDHKPFRVTLRQIKKTQQDKD